MAQLTGKELRVKDEIFKVCDALFEEGLNRESDFTIDAIRSKRKALFGKAGNFESIRRYRNQWFIENNLKIDALQASSTQAKEVRSVEHVVFEQFLNQQTLAIEEKINAQFADKMQLLIKERDAAQDKASALSLQQEQLNAMLTTKQGQIDGFEVNAKEQVATLSQAIASSERLQLQNDTLTMQLAEIEKSHQAKIEKEGAQYRTIIKQLERGLNESKKQFGAALTNNQATIDKLMTVNESQRIDAMKRQVSLDDKLAKLERENTALLHEKSQLIDTLAQKNEALKSLQLTLKQQEIEYAKQVKQHKKDKQDLDIKHVDIKRIVDSIQGLNKKVAGIDKKIIATGRKNKGHS